jgi:hypothetical protein
MSFLIMAMIFLCASTIWIAFKPSLFLEGNVTDSMRAWTCLMLYGFILPAVFGLVYRALPMAYTAALLGENLILLHLGCHMFGFGIFFAHALHPEMVQSGMGMVFLGCGVMAFLINIGAALQKRGLSEPSSAFLAAALLWLAVSSLVAMPLSSEPTFAALKDTQWSAATLQLCLLGFVMNAILGMALRLTSLRLANDPPQTNSSWFAFYITNGGLAWLFGAIAYGPAGYVMICLGVYLAGLLIFIMRHAVITQERRVEVLDSDTKMLVSAIWVLPIVTILAGLSAWIRMGNPEQQPFGLDIVTVLTAILGVAVPALVALFYQSEAILRGFHPDEPTAHLRLSSQILLASFFNYATGVCLLLGGAGVGSEKMTTLGAIFTLVGVFGFTGNLVFLGKEKTGFSQSPVSA